MFSDLPNHPVAGQPKAAMGKGPPTQIKAEPVPIPGDVGRKASGDHESPQSVDGRRGRWGGGGWGWTVWLYPWRRYRSLSYGA